MPLNISTLNIPQHNIVIEIKKKRWTIVMDKDLMIHDLTMKCLKVKTTTVADHRIVLTESVVDEYFKLSSEIRYLVEKKLN